MGGAEDAVGGALASLLAPPQESEAGTHTHVHTHTLTLSLSHSLSLSLSPGLVAAGHTHSHTLWLRVEGLGVAETAVGGAFRVYRGTSLIRKRTPIGPYCRIMPKVLGGS